MKLPERTLLETPRFSVVEQRVARPDGSEAVCTFVRHPGAVVVLPLVDDEHVCLIRNVRLTVDRELIELPAGTREADEEPAVTALRELQEETGYQAAQIEPLATFYTSPGIVDERMDAFVARGLTAGPPAREANEEIENLVVTWDEVRRMIDRGEIVDGKTLVTLLMYERHRG